MSDTQKSESRSRSRSTSTSSSDSRSCSRSQSSSRSRSRKRRFDSRSSCRSRSHSPPHGREFNHTRVYQNQRGFRGNFRGFRRPYYFHSRGQGYFRGHFQHGGRGGYNNYRPNNWQNFWQNPQQQYYPNNHNYPNNPKYPNNPNYPTRGRSHSRSPRKQSSSHSRRSDRSSSGRSPQSQTSSSCGCVKHRRAVREDVPVPKKSPEGGEGEGASSEQVGGSGVAMENVDGDETLENCGVSTDHDTSPKKTQVCSSVTAGHVQTVTYEKSSNASTDSATTCQNDSSASAAKCSGEKSPTQMFSGFGLFTNNKQTDDTAYLSAAFLRFLEEQKCKKQTTSIENNTDKDKSNGVLCWDKENGGVFEKVSEPDLGHSEDHDSAGQKEKYRSVKSCGGPTSCVSDTEGGSSFLCEDGEEDVEMSGEMRDMETSPSKGKAKRSTQEMFEECIRSLQDRVWNNELDAALCHKQVKRKEKTVKTSCKPSLLSRRSCEKLEQEMFVVMSEQCPPRASAVFSGGVDALTDDLARSSVLFNKRRNLVDSVHIDRKGCDLAVPQHLQAQQSLWNPSDIFSQHIISIVHHIKAQYFPSSGLTLNERFALYQRRAETQLMKHRTSPEIHRRMDVSSSAFKRHFLLIDEMKNAVENSCKTDEKLSDGDSLDLRLNIECRKKYLSRERDGREDEYEGRVLRESSQSSTHMSTLKTSKNHNKLKIKKKKRERTQSSSSSSSSSSVDYEEESEMSRARVGLRESVGRGRFTISGRSWNRGACHGNSNRTDAHIHTTVKNEEKYLLHSEEDDEGERKLMETGGRGRGNMVRGKGRFILRRTTNTNSTNNTSSKWVYDKFQASDDEGEQQREDVKQDHKT